MVMGFPPSASGLTVQRRRSLSWVVAIVAAAFAAPGVVHAADPAPPAQLDGPRPAAREAPRNDGDPIPAVKADYLYKFTAFVTWPSAAFEDASSPFRLCIAGHDPLGGVMDRTTRGARVGDHPVVLVRLPAMTKAPACHMLFLSSSRSQTPRQMTGMVAGLPMLTVADQGLEAPAAMIQFVEIEGRVRFEIRADAAQAAGLTVSSKLLALAASPRDVGR